MTHSPQNYAYALRWPMFAVFFLFMWWRMLGPVGGRPADRFGARVPALAGLLLMVVRFGWVALVAQPALC